MQEKINKKDYLKQIERLKVRIDNKKKDLEQNKELSLQLTGAPVGEKVTSSKVIEDKIAEHIADIVDLEKEIADDVINLIKLRKNIISKIDILENPRHIELLYRKYVSTETWEKIAHEMGYTIRQIYRLHGDALKELQIN